MYNKKQRVLAMIGIILLVLLMLSTLAAAIFDSSGKLFRVSLFLTIFVPILIWGYLWIYGILSQKHTIASLLTKEQHDALEEMKKEKAGKNAAQDEEEITISKRGMQKKGK